MTNFLTPLLLTASLLVFSLSVGAQQPNRSLTMRVLDEQIQDDSNRLDNLLTIEKDVRLAIEYSNNTSPISIPIVVHLLCNSADGYVSDNQVSSQIQVLNDAFNGTLGSQISGWPQKAGDTGISFCLASQTIEGTDTSGIVRIDSVPNYFLQKDGIKFTNLGGSDAWPTTDYLNIWVVDLGGSVSSYAQFPGGNPVTDGIVIDYRYFGTLGNVAQPYDQGLTLVKEVGHWLNLHNTFGVNETDGDDFTADTPRALAALPGCSSDAQSFGTKDMVVNFMDLSDDGCAAIFTEGQKARMLALLSGTGARASFRNSQGCQAPEKKEEIVASSPLKASNNLFTDQNQLKIFPNPVNDYINVAVNKEGLSLTVSNLQGQVVQQVTLQNGTTQISTSGLISGIYVLTIYDIEKGQSETRKVTVQK